MFLITDRVASCGSFESDDCCDISGIHLVQLCPVVCMHLQDPSCSFLFPFGCVHDIGARIHRSGVNSDVSQFAYERVCHDLERQRCERFFIRRMYRDRFSVIINAFDIRDVRRCRHIFDDRIQKFLNTFIPVCCSAADRNDRRLAGAFPEGCLQLLFRRSLILQEHHCQVLVQFADLFDHIITIHLCVSLHVIRDVGNGDIFTFFIVIDIGFHFEQVDNAFELIFLADRQLDRNCVLTQTGLDHIDGIVEVCAHDIHFVNECHTRDVVLVSLSPNIFRLWLNAAFCTENTYSSVEHSQRTLYFNCEINMSRSINDIDTML